MEWKGSLGEGPAIGEFFESVVSFANTNDGLIIVGVDDHGAHVETDTTKTKQRIVDLLETRCDPPPPNITFDVAEVDGKAILLVNVPKGTDPPYFLKRDGYLSRSELYVRSGASDRPMRRVVLDEIWKAKLGRH